MYMNKKHIYIIYKKVACATCVDHTVAMLSPVSFGSNEF